MTKFYTLNGDRIAMIGTGFAGDPVPDELQGEASESLVFDGEELVLAATQNMWLIETVNDRPIKRHPGVYPDSDWPEIECAFDDVLVRDGDGWRVQSDADKAAKAIAVAKQAVRDAIDGLSGKLTASYTSTEEKGWIVMLAEAKTFNESGKPEDAPALALDAAIRGDTLANRAAAVLAAAQITGVIPSLASGMRSKAEELLDATDGSPEQINAVTALLLAKGDAILNAALAGNQDAIIAAATTGWDI